jgi:hypothetical protein
MIGTASQFFKMRAKEYCFDNSHDPNDEQSKVYGFIGTQIGDPDQIKFKPIHERDTSEEAMEKVPERLHRQPSHMFARWLPIHIAS